jgi:hypothetical protein
MENLFREFLENVSIGFVYSSFMLLFFGIGLVFWVRGDEDERLIDMGVKLDK